jgi:hypothetical protein
VSNQTDVLNSLKDAVAQFDTTLDADTLAAIAPIVRQINAHIDDLSVLLGDVAPTVQATVTVSALSTSDVAALSTDQVAALSTSEVSALSTAQV